ncbi:MAG: 50S ribosomal protein L25/general stress protein Ctc [Lysobacterales bacterium]
MSAMIKIPASVRELRGKGASRRLRHQGLVPGILYGGDRDPVSLQISHQFLSHAVQNDAFYTSILEIAVDDGRTQKVIVRDLQRHPANSDVMHVDFLRISDTEKLNILLPIHFLNEEESPAGKKSGVVISHLQTEVEISCLPKDLPESLNLDLADLDVGDSVSLSDITLPSGLEIVALVHGEDAVVVNAAHVAVEAAPADDGADEGEGESGDSASDAEGGSDD